MAATKLHEKVEGLVSDIDKRLQELEEALKEHEDLTALKARITGTAPVQARTRASGPGRVTRPRQGGRYDQYLALVRAKPGISASEVAKEMEIANNYVYRLNARGLAEGTVRKDGTQLFPTEHDPTAPDSERVKELEAAAH